MWKCVSHCTETGFGMNKSLLTLELRIETVHVLTVDVEVVQVVFIIMRLECLLDVFCTSRHYCSDCCDSELVVK